VSSTSNLGRRLAEELAAHFTATFDEATRPQPGESFGRAAPAPPSAPSAPEPWPPPSVVRVILRRARRRYLREPATARPSLDPMGCVGLFAAEELVILAQHGQWPLSSRALRWLVEPPADRARRRQRRARRIEAAARRLLAAELPSVLRYLRGRPQQ
jgi:hypothetical protein